MDVFVKKFKYGKNEVTIETGRIARQATGAVLVSMDNTSVLCTVVGAKEAKSGADFFRSECTIKRKHMLLGRFREVFSNVRDVPARRKR